MPVTLPQLDVDEVRSFLRNIDVEPVSLYPDEGMLNIYEQTLKLFNRSPGDDYPEDKLYAIRNIYSTLMYTLSTTK